VGGGGGVGGGGVVGFKHAPLPQTFSESIYILGFDYHFSKL